jgi:DNA mismatch endonuclease (patch repair protein)
MENARLRSEIMRAVKSENTGPEEIVRSMVHRLGFRFRLHRKDLPGKPDLVFPKLKKVIFVHGCFWHGHRCSRGNRVPVHNRAYWIEKIEKNRQRDRKAARLLRQLGWGRMVVWECSLKKPDRARSAIDRFLDG